MAETVIRARSLRGRTALTLAAVAIILLPDSALSIVADTAPEAMILRMLVLAGIAVLAIAPWAIAAEVTVRRRLRRWLVPGVGALVVYALSSDPLYVLLGFCLLAGAALDMWATRAHVASAGLRSRLTANDDEGRYRAREGS